MVSWLDDLWCYSKFQQVLTYIPPFFFLKTLLDIANYGKFKISCVHRESKCGNWIAEQKPIRNRMKDKFDVKYQTIFLFKHVSASICIFKMLESSILTENVCL